MSTQTPSPEPVRYRVTIPDPRDHHVAVEVRLPPAGFSGEHRLNMPAWTPGSYLVREFARHVAGVSATDESGLALPVDKTAKATWRVRSGEGQRAVVRYRVYAHELTVRTSHVTDGFALLNGASIFVALEGALAAPALVDVAPPAGWRVFSALPRTPDGALAARDFDELVDSPIVCGDLPSERVDVPGGPAGGVEVVWCGWESCDAPPPRAQVLADVASIFPEARAVFDAGWPFARYLLFVCLADGFGGLEHKNGAVLLFPRTQLRPREKYERFLSLVAHELFHAWNGKRLRPRPLGPFDYEREAYTRALWVVEGFTSYYDGHLVRRAGLSSPEAYLKYVAGQLKRLDDVPGRAAQSLEESSFDAWIKLYRPDENSANSTVSYYLKGEIVGLLLDLEIRARSVGARSLDDVMRRLWARWADERAPGYEDVDPLATLAEVGGAEVGALAERYVRGRDELDYGATLARAGMALERTWPEDHLKGWLGVVTGVDGPSRRPVVRVVLRGSPAERGGVEPGDEIVALDGLRVDDQGLAERCRVRAPGTTVRLTVFRIDVLRDMTVTLGEAPPEQYKIVKRAEATPAERAIYESWMRARWDEPPAPAAAKPPAPEPAPDAA